MQCFMKCIAMLCIVVLTGCASVGATSQEVVFVEEPTSFVHEDMHPHTSRGASVFQEREVVTTTTRPSSPTPKSRKLFLCGEDRDARIEVDGRIASWGDTSAEARMQKGYHIDAGCSFVLHGASVEDLQEIQRRGIHFGCGGGNLLISDKFRYDAVAPNGLSAVGDNARSIIQAGCDMRIYLLNRNPVSSVGEGDPLADYIDLDGIPIRRSCTRSVGDFTISVPCSS